MTDPLHELRTFAEIGPADREAVGGKALGLARLANAGLPVPPGFCITTDAYRRLRDRGPGADPLLAAGIACACRRLGGPLAVRSSATVEDGADLSFAGLQDTVLGVTEAAAVLDAVARCWASLDSDRATAYRREHGVGREVAMGVVVQQLVPAEVAGVLYTRDPLDPNGHRMLVEAAWGLGEGVVSGRVMPDSFRLDPDTGAVREQRVGAKAVQRTAAGWEPVAPERRAVPCLDGRQLAELAELGRQVEALFGDARDVEWAWAAGRFWIVQARPVTAAAGEREGVRREEIAALAARAEPGGTVWVRFNLAESLPAPTPLTWALLRRLVSGGGGLGQMYRDLGFDPDPALDEEAVFDLVCGRPYCHLGWQLRLQFRRPPLEYPFAAFKAAPQRALDPRPVPCPGRADVRFWLTLPLVAARLGVRLARFRRDLPRRLRAEVLPAFAEAARHAAGTDLAPLPTGDLVRRLEEWAQATLVTFARDALKPTALAGLALDDLGRRLTRLLGPDRARAVLAEAVLGVRPDPEADLPEALWQVADGRLGRAEFLRRFGHRAGQELELAQPRWDEEPAALDGLLATAGVGREPPGDRWEQVVAEAGGGSAARRALEGKVRSLREYLGLRETCKHYLLLGWAEVRRTAVELDRRHGLAGGVFFLLPDELPRLAAGADLSAAIAERRRRRRVALSLEVPSVLFSDDLEAIGRPSPVAGAETVTGIPLSAGVAEAPALVLDEPGGVAPSVGPYVLVCPSTDPGWVPLFARAHGLVMETGGVLSHGAIVAREFGLPAVGAIADARRRFRTGQRLRVDGTTGTVTVVA
jgi:rifampicin phosphotransferase